MKPKKVFCFFEQSGTARLASEIEEFPIAVTKKHFPDEYMNQPEGEN